MLPTETRLRAAGSGRRANTFDVKVQPTSTAAAGVSVWGSSSRYFVDVHGGEGVPAVGLWWRKGASSNRAFVGEMDARENKTLDESGTHTNRVYD